MPSRISKRQQRELDEIAVLAAAEDEENPSSIAQDSSKTIGFAALDVDEPKSSNKKKKKSAAVSNSTPSTKPASTPKKKPTKKQKKPAVDDIDDALKELSVKYPELQHIATKQSSFIQSFAQLLSVSLAHLDSEAEMRKFFGSKVVQSTKPKRRQPVVHRSNLTRPQPSWSHATHRESLSLVSLLEHPAEPGEQWWRVTYTKKYTSITKSFLAIVQSGDPSLFPVLLQRAPWHADTLLQLAEVFRHREEHSQASDFLSRALFTYERAFIGSFTFTSGLHRLDFDYVENRPFFLALHRQVSDLQRRGCTRTAFEFARLLYGLDPYSDPHGALFHLDYLAVKANMCGWLLSLFSLWQSEEREGTNPALLPGILYSRALALKLTNASDADAALKDAILSYPQILRLLCDKLSFSLPQHLLTQHEFSIRTDRGGLSEVECTIHLLSHLYVQRASTLWKDHSSWLSDTASSLSSSKEWGNTSTRKRFENTSHMGPEFRESINRHLTIIQSTPPSTSLNVQRLLSFVFSSTLATVNSYDPLPPFTTKTLYNDEFFEGVSDFLSGTATARAQTRLLERLIPDPHSRAQLQGIFNAHPALRARFQGDVVEFVQQLAQMEPGDMNAFLTGLAMEAMEGQEEQQGGMPGGLDFDEDDGVVNPQVNADVEAQANDDDDDDNEEEEEEEEEEVPALPVRMLRSFVGMFWPAGTSAAERQEE